MDQLYIFGTGNAAVTRCYNTCFALFDGGEYFLTDAGGGNGILTILEDMNVPLEKIHHLFVSHSHNDHVLGVVWLIRFIAAAMKKGTYQGDFHIYCHRDLAAVIQELCRLTLQEKFCRLFGERIHLVPVGDGQETDVRGYRVQFFDIGSTKLAQYGYTLETKDGLRLTFTGDEPCRGQNLPYIGGADWLIHEAFCLDSQREIFHPHEKHHGTVKEACETAQRAGVKNLVLLHTEDKNLSRRKEQYRKEGTSFFSGNLFVPDDREIIALS